jgi:hypothetical protein
MVCAQRRGQEERMRPVHKELAEPVARGLLGAATVDGGPTDEQRHIIDAIVHGYFDVAIELSSLEPLDPAGLAVAVADPKARHRVVELMIVLEFSRHPGSDPMAQRVQEYAAALDVDEKMQVVARDALHSARAELNADYQRYHDDYDVEPQFAGAEDAEMASRLRALEHCPPDSLGRAYFDFYQRYGLTFPGEPGGGDVIFVAHDFSHVLSGYEPNGPGELALQAMLVSATDGDQHFSNFCASLSLHEAGLLESTVAITPKVGTLARPGAAEELADAIRRGAQCTADFAAIDHLAHVDEPLEDVRRDLSIPGRRA